MAKKKKTALKPVARGFATTSQPKKVVPEPAPEESASTAVDPAQIQGEGLEGDSKVQADGENAEALDWEDDAKLEEGIYQGYVERLQEKGDREVAKIMKVIEFDRRTNKGYINLDIEPSLRDEILATDRTGQHPNPVSLTSPTDPTAKEKYLLRMYIIYRVLTKLGHKESLVLQCLKLMGEKDTWEDGLKWIYLSEYEASRMSQV